eukprot:TRINITY_DN10851_c0_g1_i2.p1 TRINITY_DN10851_c0_g1~~TRINITY_DN10851_c0_g1_i2.p1  ORF type:complete len:443 (-),score=110.49 TRINITY_DN10851_c0_g1_i2:58-1353(-)
MGVTDLLPKAHDVPVLGIFTHAFADNFGDYVFTKLSSEELRKAFDAVDTNKNGKLDKTEIAAALRQAGYAERKIQHLVVEKMDGKEELDFEGFQDLVHPKETDPLDPAQYVPILGNTVNMLGTLCNESVGQLVHHTCGPNLTDEVLEKVFGELDQDGSGALDQKELAGALRRLWFSESKIASMIEAVKGKDLSCYEFKKFVRGPKYSPSLLNHVPLVGPAISTHIVGSLDVDYKCGAHTPEKDMREAFDHIDKSKTGKLDKTQVGDVLRELGRSEHQIQKMLDSLPAEDTSTDFDGFKKLLQEFPARRDFVKWIGPVPVPNPAKVHDVPLVGTFTELAQDTLVDTYSATAQAALRSLRKLPIGDLKAKFDQFDKDKSGKLEKPEQAQAMRSLGLYESEVKKALDHAGDKASMNFDEFVDMVRNGGRWFTAR